MTMLTASRFSGIGEKNLPIRWRITRSWQRAIFVRISRLGSFSISSRRTQIMQNCPNSGNHALCAAVLAVAFYNSQAQVYTWHGLSCSFDSNETHPIRHRCKRTFFLADGRITLLKRSMKDLSSSGRRVKGFLGVTVKCEYWRVRGIE